MPTKTPASANFEDSVFLSATSFRLHRFHDGGQDRTQAASFAEAMHLAMAELRAGRRVLVYAVNAADREALLPQQRWNYFAGLPHLSIGSSFAMRTPSTTADCKSSLRRVRTTPARKPRTECDCQPVALVSAAIVAPVNETTNTWCHVPILDDYSKGIRNNFAEPLSDKPFHEIQKTYRGKLWRNFFQSRNWSDKIVVRSGEGIGKTSTLLPLLLYEAQDDNCVSENGGIERFAGFAFRSHEQAERKAQENLTYAPRRTKRMAAQTR